MTTPAKDILEKVSDDGDDIFEKVSDDAKAYQVSHEKLHFTERLIFALKLLNGWTDFEYQYIKIKRIAAQTFLYIWNFLTKFLFALKKPDLPNFVKF